MIARAKSLYAGLHWRGLGLIAVLAFFVSAALAFSRPTEMLVNGQRVDSDVQPVTTTSSRAYVPLRTLADALGAETQVDGKTGNIAVVLGNTSLRLRVGDTHATLNGMPLTFKHAPFRVRGRVMISLDQVARALNVRARYDSRNARIEVVTPGIGETL
ncbi:MAG: copper amine oxidase N-terminal domain-containing protein [Candidatus Eremiobacteraeota bacterium]|nr:copper amine oxidase N-terminal domain-containing protein [Candidatus Eremiobacteraeota bacterium]MBV8499244.1 copper amine oxidase N-terminal domain-containing protein [Candidatus Eremiobacteraeota bacterium]